MKTDRYTVDVEDLEEVDENDVEEMGEDGDPTVENISGETANMSAPPGHEFYGNQWNAGSGMKSADPATMKGSDINRELDKLDEHSSKLAGVAIERGMGHDKPTDRAARIKAGTASDLDHAMHAVSMRVLHLRTEVDIRHGFQGKSRVDPKYTVHKNKPRVDKTNMSTPSIRDARITIASARERVDFAVIDKKQHTMQSRLSADMATQVAKMVQKLLGDDENLKLLTDDDPSDIANVEPQGVDIGRLKTLVQKALADSWQLGREMAGNELRRISKAVPYVRDAAHFADLRTKAAQYFESNAFRMAGNVSDGVRALIQAELGNSVRFGRSPGQTREAIWSRLTSKGFSSREAVRTMIAGSPNEDGIERALNELGLDSEESAAHYLDTLSRTNLFEAMNEARYAEYSDPALGGFVVGLRYSAILDDRTTQICEALHDHTFATDSEVWDTYRPPNHYNCRSVLVPVTKLDIEDGEWDGVDDKLPDVEPQVGFK